MNFDDTYDTFAINPGDCINTIEIKVSGNLSEKKGVVLKWSLCFFLCEIMISIFKSPLLPLNGFSKAIQQNVPQIP